MPEPACSEYPLVMLTGRGTAAQWHTQTRTGKSSVLARLYPNEPFVEINPSDAKELGLKPQQNVIVQSRRGQATANAMITPTVAPGNVFMPMHYEEVNQLTLSHFDPYSKQPSYKDCAVKIIPDV